MPTQFEEVVEAPDLPAIEQFFPQRRDAAFDLPFRRRMAMHPPRRIRRRQGAPVQLSVRRQRQRSQHHER